MRTSIAAIAVALIITLGFGMVGCGGKGRSSILVDGSSTVYPITQAVGEEYEKINNAVKIPVGVSGTGGGFKRFSKGETDISDASRPIKPKEHAACVKNGIEYIELPVAFDGLTIVVNKANTWATSLSVKDLEKIFSAGSTITNWNQVNPSYPDVAMKLYAPGTDSGTFDYFKEVVLGKNGSMRGDDILSVSEDDNILVRGVVGARGGLGFFGCSYYFENKDKLSAVSIDGGNGPVLPSAESIESGRYFPFSRPLFIYLNKKSLETKPGVRGFIDFYLENAARFASEKGYVGLPAEVYGRVKARVKDLETGSVYLDAKGEKKKAAIGDF